MKAEFKFRQFPPIAGELFEREMTFRSFNNSLDRTVQGYNRLKTNTTRVEYDLIKDQLDEIDVKLNDAENLLNWNSDGKNFELSTNFENYSMKSRKGPDTVRSLSAGH